MFTLKLRPSLYERGTYAISRALQLQIIIRPKNKVLGQIFLCLLSINLAIFGQPVWAESRFKFVEELSEKECLEVLENGQKFLPSSKSFYTYIVFRGQVYRFHLREQSNWDVLDISCRRGMRMQTRW